jgi:hypothetical protein
MSYSELLVRWTQSDVNATAYALTWSGSRQPEHVFLVEQLRRCADVWHEVLQRESSHMQQRMPRV